MAFVFTLSSFAIVYNFTPMFATSESHAIDVYGDDDSARANTARPI